MVNSRLKINLIKLFIIHYTIYRAKTILIMEDNYLYKSKDTKPQHRVNGLIDVFRQSQ